MEIKLTKKQIERNERDDAIRTRYKEYMELGSSTTAVYEELAKDFGVSRTTVAYIVNGYPYAKKRRRKYLRAKNR